MSIPAQRPSTLLTSLARPPDPSSFLPIVALALVFNFSNALGFTYADRDARRRWATNAASGFASGIPGLGGLGGLGGQLLGGAVRSGFTRMLG